MARSRRALLRKGNVTNIADARKKREEKQQANEQALANSRLSTLEEASAQQTAATAPEVSSASQEFAKQHGAEAQAVREQAGMSRSSGEFSGFDLNDVKSYTVSDTGGRPPGGTTPENPGDSILQTTVGKSGDTSAEAAGADSSPDTSAEKGSPEKVSNRRFNREKVDAIKKAIANGSYQINPQRTADKFIEREAPA